MKKLSTILMAFTIVIAMMSSCKSADDIRDRAPKVKIYKAAVATTLGKIHKSTNADFQKAIDDKVGILVDVRTPEEYAAGHLVGAVNVNFKKRTFKSYISSFDKNTPILIYCRSGNRSGKAEIVMRALGFLEVYDLAKGYKGWLADSLEVTTEDNEANIALQASLKENAPTVEPLASLGATSDIDNATLQKMIANEEAILVDVRTPKEYAEGFIEGAVNVDWKDRHFAKTIVKEVSNHKPVIIYCRSGNRASKAMTVMQAMGFTTVYNLGKGIKGWNAEKLPLATLEVKGDKHHLDVKNFNNGIAGKAGILIDIRTPKEFEDYHIPGAKMIDFKNKNFKNEFSKLDKKVPVLIYCRSGGRSRSATKILTKMGYDVYNLDKGMIQWRKEGMPVEGKNVSAKDKGEEGC